MVPTDPVSLIIFFLAQMLDTPLHLRNATLYARNENGILTEQYTSSGITAPAMFVFVNNATSPPTRLLCIVHRNEI